MIHPQDMRPRTRIGVSRSFPWGRFVIETAVCAFALIGIYTVWAVMA